VSAADGKWQLISLIGRCADNSAERPQQAFEIELSVPAYRAVLAPHRAHCSEIWNVPSFARRSE